MDRCGIGPKPDPYWDWSRLRLGPETGDGGFRLEAPGSGVGFMRVSAAVVAVTAVVAAVVWLRKSTT